MKRIIFLVIIALFAIFYGCSEPSLTESFQTQEMDDEDKEWPLSTTETGYEEEDDEGEDSALTEVQAVCYPQENPYGLAVGVYSPFRMASETTSEWGPPDHYIVWEGDWSTDIWVDDKAAGLDRYISCGRDAYLNIKPVNYPGGKKATQLRAVVVEENLACEEGGYEYGGYFQKWRIEAMFEEQYYVIGWLTYAHIDNQVYQVNDVINLSEPVKIGTVFQDGIYGDCWGSCHLHVELENNGNESCYTILPTKKSINLVGVLGGTNCTTGHCPKQNYARSASNCDASSSYSSSYDCGMTYDNLLSTKWVSDGQAPESWMVVDLGQSRDVYQFVVKHATSGTTDTDPRMNTKKFAIYVGDSMTGPWRGLAKVNNDTQAKKSIINIEQTSGRYFMLYVKKPNWNPSTGQILDNYTRIPEFKIVGF